MSVGGHTSVIFRPSATVAVLVEQEGRFLMVEEDTPEGIRINQPAGHLEQGESLIDAAIRETLEETGYHVKPVGWLGCHMARFQRAAEVGEPVADITYLRFVICAQVLQAPAANVILSSEIRRVFWASAAEVRAMRAQWRSPLVWQCLEAEFERRRKAQSLLPLSALHVDPSVYHCDSHLPAGNVVNDDNSATPFPRSVDPATEDRHG